MTKFVRLAALAAAATIAATPAVAAPVSVTGPKPTASAKILKALTLTRVADLDFGTIVIGAVVGTETVSIDQSGNVTCGSSGNLTCDDTTAQAAVYNVRGTNNQVVTIAATNSTLTGPSGTLTFVPDAPADVTLTSSGAPGNDFNVGGEIDLTAATPEGLYSGDMEVTVQYF